MKKVKRIVAIMLAAVMVITAANFMPENAMAEEITGTGVTTEQQTEEPAGESTGQQTETTTEQPAGEATEEQTGETTEKSTEQQTEETRVESTEQQAETTTEQPAEEAADEASLIMGVQDGLELLGDSASGPWILNYNKNSSIGSTFTVTDVKGSAVNTRTAICIEQLNIPVSDYVSNAWLDMYTISDSNYPGIEKLAYYSYIGPGASAAEAALGWSGTTHLREATHFMLDSFFHGKTAPNGESLNTGNQADTYATQLKNWIASQPDLAPSSSSISFSPSTISADNITLVNGMQQTCNITLTGNSLISTTLTLDSGVTAYKNGTAYTGSVTLNGGDTFYLTYPAGTTNKVFSTAVSSAVGPAVYFYVPGGHAAHGYQCMLAASARTVSASLNVSFNKVSTGSIKIHKISSNGTVTNGNPCYSLEGAVYKLYKSYADAQANSNVVATLTTDKNGYAQADNITLGTYLLKETVAPKGYKLDPNYHQVTITASHTASAPLVVDLTDTPQMDPVRVLLTKQGEDGTKLQGAEYTFRFYSVQMDTDPAKSGYTAERTWVFKTDENGFIYYDKVGFVSGDDLYTTTGGLYQMPKGTLTIQESKAPEGYLIDNTLYVRKIEPGSSDSVSTYNAPTVTEYQVRGDLEFVKLDDETNEPIGNVEFTITNNETGEIHTVWTDEDGYYSTSSDFAAHSFNTNGGARGDGVWFGTETVDDGKGALIYGTYTVKEQRCEANKNKYKDLAAFTVTVNENGVTVDAGDIYNDRFPTLSTSVKDSLTGTNIAALGDEVTAVDTVHLENLEAGHTYTISGYPVVKSTELQMTDAEGADIIEKVTFEATEENMDIDVSYMIPTGGLAGDDIVFYEYLYDEAYPDELIASHEDIEDEGQTLHFPDVRTTALDDETDSHQGAAAGETVSLTDYVSCTNLIVGKEYTVDGVIMDADTGEAFKDAEGNEITAGLTFTADEKNMTVEINFIIDAELVRGRTTVVFEDLYYEDIKIATHADLTDEEQTVDYPEIHTTATNKDDGSHAGTLKESFTLIDRVTWKNLIAGKEYTFYGTVMDAETGEAVKDKDGNEITAEYTFTAECKDGTADVVFTFDSYIAAGKKTVVFEDLYYEDIKIATHADLEDGGQTVEFPPLPPDTPKTGDVTPVAAALALIMSAAGIIIIFVKRKNER